MENNSKNSNDPVGPIEGEGKVLGEKSTEVDGLADAKGLDAGEDNNHHDDSEEDDHDESTISAKKRLVLTVVGGVACIAASAFYFFGSVGVAESKAQKPAHQDEVKLAAGGGAKPASEGVPGVQQQSGGVKDSESLIEQATGKSKYQLEVEIARNPVKTETHEPYKVMEPLANVDDDEEEAAKEKAAAREKVAADARAKKEARMDNSRGRPRQNIQTESIEKKLNEEQAVPRAKECEVVDRPHAKSLVSKPNDIRNNKISSYWKAVNTTSRTVAIVVNQDGHNVALAYLSPNSSLGSRIPATYLKFAIKYGDECVNWHTEEGIFSALPLEMETQQKPAVRPGKEPAEPPKVDPSKGKKEKESYYKLAIFETIIEESTSRGMEARTRLTGYAKE
jgi:hypothetical protein